MAFLLPSVAYVVLIYGYPLYRDIVISFQDYGFGGLATGKASFIGLANYREMLSSPVTRRAMVNTLAFTVGSVVLQFTIGFAIALYLDRKTRMSAILRNLVLVPWVMPLVVTGTVFSLVFATSNGLANQVLTGLGLIDQNIGWLSDGVTAVVAITLANIWAGVPFNAVLLYSGLQDVPPEQQEAAAIDGANTWQRFRYVTVPIMRPVILIVLMLGIVYTLKVFDLVIVLTGGGPANQSHLLSSWSYQQAFTRFDFGTGTAVANILLVVSLVVGAIYVRMSRSDSRASL